MKFRIKSDGIWKDAIAKVLGTYTNHSKNPSFELGTGTQVEVRRNLCSLPKPRSISDVGNVYESQWSFEGSGTVGYDSGAMTITNMGGTNAGANVGGNKNVGGGAIGAGQIVTVSFKLTVVTGSVLVTPRIFKEDNNMMSSGPEQSYSVGEHIISLTATTPASTTKVWARPLLRGSSSTSLRITEALIENIGTVLPYFDGSTNDGFDTASLTPSWTGTANNSASVLMGEGVLGASPAGFTSPTWLSSDNPNHGSKFARTLLKSASGSLRAVDATGVVSGDITTVMGTFRLNRAVNVRPTIWKSGVDDKSLGFRVIPANEWTEIRDTYTPTAASSEFGLFSNFWQAGDILDYDSHYVIKGTYSGDYFDGSTAATGMNTYGWDGLANASTSTGRFWSPLKGKVRQKRNGTWE